MYKRQANGGEVEGIMVRKKQPSRLVSQDEDCEGPVRIRALVSEPVKFHICSFSANIRKRRSPSMQMVFVTIDANFPLQRPGHQKVQ